MSHALQAPTVQGLTCSRRSKRPFPDTRDTKSMKPIAIPLLVTASFSAAVFFAGCGSSSSSRSGGGGGGGGGFTHAPAQFATASGDTLGERIDALNDGDALELPMYQQGLSIPNPDELAAPDDEQANFSIRIGTGNDSDVAFFTIETADGTSFTWNDWDDDVLYDEYRGADFLELYGERFAGANGTAAVAWAYLYDYVSFGYWEVADYEEGEEEFIFLSLRGGLFWQGLETDPQRMPGTGSATYVGLMEGAGDHAAWGEYWFEGNLTVTANFAAGTLEGRIDGIEAGAWHAADGFDESRTAFNDIVLEAGSIAGNRFDGRAVAGAPGDSQLSFAQGAEGDFKGGFFGPDAEEIGGQLLLQEEGNIAGGAFGGR